jgi:phage terminase Nu1 subunit (DNA packaging protein)
LSDSRSLDEIAQLFCVTEKAVRGWIAAGMPVEHQGRQGRGKKTTISLEKAVEWYFHENFERLELDRARTRLANEQQRKLALENAVRSKELVELAVWERALTQTLGELRSMFLAFPTKLAPQLDGDINRRKDCLERAVHELLENLANASPDVVVSGEPGSTEDSAIGPAAAAEAHSEPVGGPAPAPVKRKQRRAGPVEN